MASSRDGFFFTFDEGEEEQQREKDSPACTHSHAGRAWPAPTISVAAHPWVALTPERVEEWRVSYPQSCGSTHAGAAEKAVHAATTRPQQLSLPVRVASTGTLHEGTLCFQTAPELAQLTQPPAPHEGSESSRAGRAGTGSTSPAATESDSDGTGHKGRDIVPGRYYGGLKVWSCAPDLARFLLADSARWRSQASAGSGASEVPLVVAEVGCGQGLPALAAVLLGATRIILQDYNAEVLDVCVKPNLAATLALADNRAVLSSRAAGDVQVKLLHGDWVNLDWAGELCDRVLGSDVTFDEEACEKLAVMLQRCLRPHTGVALIATKVYYFGTNGGSLEFREQAARHGLTVAEEFPVPGDSGMSRVILKVVKSP